VSDHLSPTILNALADGELSAEQLAHANEHLAGCSSCTSSALFQTLLKSSTAKAGQRYAPPPHLQQRLAHLASQADSRSETPELRATRVPTSRSPWRFEALGWVAAAALLLITVSIGLVQRSAQRSQMASTERAALITEVFDQHVATLAANSPPQVLSSDRHTVKPWFQGKIPFSFNLPENLPRDTTLDGANLTYLNNQPVAQLLYSIGRHRVSVFVRQKSGSQKSGTQKPGTPKPGATTASELLAEHSGFHVKGFLHDDLEVVAVSDVDPARLSDLLTRIEQSQSSSQNSPK
jgi:anti-sigma factor RsiW